MIKTQNSNKLAITNGGGVHKCILYKPFKKWWYRMSKIYAIPYYPIGAILEFDREMDMASIYGGTWELYGAGRMTVGINTSDTDFNTPSKTGGSKTHIQTIAEMPSHTHQFDYPIGSTLLATGSGSVYGEVMTKNKVKVDTSTSGDGTPMDIMNPYIVVYRYRKVAD